MKKLLFLAVAFTFSSFLFAQKKAADVAKFTAETIDLGKIKQGMPTTATFVVTNIGTEPLIIEQASPTCGCTIGDYTKSPIAPGKTGTITATYNAAALNHFDKHLTVKFAGIDESKSITITGDVLAAEEYDKWLAETNEAKKKTETPAPPVKSNKPAPKNSLSKNNN